MRYTLKTLVLAMGLATFFLGGCAALQHRNLETKVQMQQSIFIDPDLLADKPVYVRVTNQTGKADLNFDNIVAQKLMARGHKITKNSKEAGVRVLVNFLYLDKASQDMSTEGAMAGGFGGLVAGSALSHGSFGTSALAGAGGAMVGALAGSLMSVDKFIGIVDIQVEQPLQKAVTKHTKAKTGSRHDATANQRQTSSIGSQSSVSGSSSDETSDMAYDETVTRKQNKTRIVAEATQTNIDEKKATEQIKEQLADAIAGFM